MPDNPQKNKLRQIEEYTSVTHAITKQTAEPIKEFIASSKTALRFNFKKKHNKYSTKSPAVNAVIMS